MAETVQNVVQENQEELQQPVQGARAQLDFQKPPEPEQPGSDLERRLRDLDGDMRASLSEETEQPDQAEQPEQQQQPSNLPKPEELDLPEDLGLQQEQTLPPVDEILQKIEDPNIKELVGYFKQEMLTMQQELAGYRTQRAQDDLKSSLSSEWGISGEEFDSRMNAVVERFGKYPKELQQRLDNLEGAKLIWAKIEQETAAKNQQVPSFQKSRPGVSGNANRTMFKQSEIVRMSPAEYERNADRILYAYQMGLVDKDY